MAAEPVNPRVFHPLRYSRLLPSPIYTGKMMKFATTLFACGLLLNLPAGAQNAPQNTQNLPSAPSPVQPRFPGAASPAPPPTRICCSTPSLTIASGSPLAVENNMMIPQ